MPLFIHHHWVCCKLLEAKFFLDYIVFLEQRIYFNLCNFQVFIYYYDRQSLKVQSEKSGLQKACTKLSHQLVRFNLKMCEIKWKGKPERKPVKLIMMTFAYCSTFLFNLCCSIMFLTFIDWKTVNLSITPSPRSVYFSPWTLNIG